jgi:large subunit ribosomal protein L17
MLSHQGWDETEAEADLDPPELTADSKESFIMRHRNAGFKLGRNTSHRRALLRNLVTSVIVEDRVETTVAKAKAVRPLVEKMITLGKKGDLHSRRQALSFLMTDKAVSGCLRPWLRATATARAAICASSAPASSKGDGAEKAFIELLGRRKAAGRQAPEARRHQGQEARRARKAVGREQEGRRKGRRRGRVEPARLPLLLQRTNGRIPSWDAPVFSLCVYPFSAA